MGKISRAVRTTLATSLVYFSAANHLSGNYRLPKITDIPSAGNGSLLEARVEGSSRANPQDELSKEVMFFLGKLSENIATEKAWETYVIEGTKTKVYMREEKGHKVSLFTKGDILEAFSYEGSVNKTSGKMHIIDYMQNGPGLRPGGDEFSLIDIGDIKGRFGIGPNSDTKEFQLANNLYLGTFFRVCRDFGISLE